MSEEKKESSAVDPVFISLVDIPVVLGKHLAEKGVPLKPSDLKTIYTLVLFDFLDNVHDKTAMNTVKELQEKGITNDTVLNSTFGIKNDNDIKISEERFKRLVHLYYHKTYLKYFKYIDSM